MTDLIERLRLQAELGLFGTPPEHQHVGYSEAADAIQSRDEEISRLLDILKRLRDFDGWDGTYHASKAYDAKQEARATLEKRA